MFYRKKFIFAVLKLLIVSVTIAPPVYIEYQVIYRIRGKMEDDDIAPNTYLQLIQSAPAESYVSTTIFQDRNVVVLARHNAE